MMRAAKHLYKSYMQGADMMNLSPAISHFLNCFIGSFPTPHTQVAMEEVSLGLLTLVPHAKLVLHSLVLSGTGSML